jgi:hypothetical protein
MKNKNLLTLVFVYILILCMVFIPNPFTWILYPLLIIGCIYPFIPAIFSFIRKHPILITIQFLLALTYYVSRINNILQLELWSDEIMSLIIAHDSFQTIAKNALLIGAFPPLHYWELWFLEKIYIFVPPPYIEFIYRIPYMVIHTLTAMLFSAIILYKLKQITGNSIYKNSIYMISFIGYFFNPILFSYSLEIRPYAQMAAVSVLTIFALETKYMDTLKYIPVQLLCFMTSFFHLFLYIPIAIYNYTSKNRLTLFLTIAFTLTLYLLFAPLITSPIPTSKPIVIISIYSSLHTIQQILFPYYFQILIFFILIIMTWKNTLNKFFIMQIVYITICISILAYITQYSAFAPRHYIMTLPLLTYILYSSLIRKPSIFSYLVICIIVFNFTIPWIYKTETMIKRQQFFPKTSTGIKNILTYAKYNTIQKIYLEQDSDKSNPFYWEHIYIDYVTLWYSEQYGFTVPERISSSSICTSPYNTENSLFLLYFTTKCPTLPHSKILQYTILGK